MKKVQIVFRNVFTGAIFIVNTEEGAARVAAFSSWKRVKK